MAAQNISVNTTGQPAVSSALLDIGNGNSLSGGDTKGLLIPRVALTNAGTADHSAGIVPNPNNKLIVFNTNAAVTNGNGAGLYYYDSANATTGKWVFLTAASNGPGTSGQALVSQGAGNPPQWSTLSTSAAAGGQGSALGAAMMTAYMDSIGLFTPHTNNCAGTEAFVPLYSGATVGYCIEKDERAAAYWTDAVRTCLAAGKRLPEAFEWQVGCDNAGSLGLNNMTGNWEWASNFALPKYSGSDAGGGAAIFGGSGCGYASWGWLGNSAGSRSSFAFRCVH